MKALHVAKYGRFPVLTEVPVPNPTNQQMLVKMKYAPVNPSDLFFYMGKYGVKKQGFPIVGFEGSGIIQQSQNKALIGKKVSVVANRTNGTHATHILTSLDEVMIWPDSADLQAISMAFVNPLSCVGLCRIMREHKFDNVLISAAASQIGKMIVASLRKDYPSLPIFGLNRTNNKADELTKLGITETILIEDPPSQKLKQLTGKTLFLDCVGGNFAGKTFNMLGPESLMVCYGRQSGEDLGAVDLGGLYYSNKSIRGFWLNNWLKQMSKQEIQAGKQQVVTNFTIYKSKVRETVPIQNFMDGYRKSTKDKSEGKILLEL